MLFATFFAMIMQKNKKKDLIALMFLVCS